MKLAFFHDGPIYRDEQGNHHNGILNDDIIDRYFYVADEFVSVTRIYEMKKTSDTTIIHHDHVRFRAIPNLNTLRGKLLDQRKCRNIIDEEVKACDYVVARVPSYAGSMAIESAKKHRKPYLTEVVGCPWDSLWNYSWKGKLLAPSAYFSLKKTVKDAPYVIYVTNEFLQKRYPTRGKNCGCSNVQITQPEPSVFEKRQEKIKSSDSVLTIGTAAAVDVPYKGQRYILEAIARLKQEGYPVQFRYELAGGGNQEPLKKVAQELGIEDRLVFKGGMAHKDVLLWMDTLDLYAQPSRQEGLPRALIEAMSRGLPALGAKTGGIPELLMPEFISRNDKNYLDDLCRILRSFDMPTMLAQSERNYEESKQYYIEYISEKRKHMLDSVFRGK